MSDTRIRFSEFFEVAALVGHDAERLRAGEEICTYITLPTFEEGCRVLTRATAEQRAVRREIYFTENLQARQWLGQSLHDNGEAAILTGGELSELGLQSMNRHLPFRVKAISVLHKTLAPGEQWDVSVRGAVWGLEDSDDLCVVLNIAQLDMAPGASIVVRGNLFSFVCGHLRSHATNAGSPTDFQIGILPTPFSQDHRHGKPHDGLSGAPGTPGAHGADGRPLRLASSLLGPVLAEDPAHLQPHGADGADGENGGPGDCGRNGGMCKTAEITIRRLEGHLTVFSQAGKGGQGADGGNGGNGGDGGNGSAGIHTLQGHFAGGNGGLGGNAGHGGFAGHGGNGGIASNIFINLPPEQEAQVTRIALPSEPGFGGLGGLPGLPGHGGKGGAGPTPESTGQDGLPGLPGKARRAGKTGRSRPAPVIFLNEKI